MKHSTSHTDPNPQVTTDILKQSDNWEIRWYNPERTVLHCRVFDKWTWSEAYDFIQEIDQTVETSERGIYTVIQLEGAGDRIPADYAIPNIKQLLLMESPPNEKEVIFISSSSVLITFIQIGQQAQRFLSGMTTDRIQHFRTLDTAFAYLTGKGVLS